MPKSPSTDEFELPQGQSSPVKGSSSSVQAAHEPAYDGATIAYHWATAACVAVLWCIGQTIDYFPKGTPRISARSAHILLGAALAAVLVARIVWRIRFGRRLPAASAGALRVIQTGGHLALYALLVATVAVGVANTWIRGDTIIGLFKIPSLAPGANDLREQVEDVHAWLANTLLVVAGLHATLALLHGRAFGHPVMRRMFPRRADR